MDGTTENVDEATSTALVWINQTKDVFWVVDMGLNFTYVSQSSADLSGYKPHEIQKMSVDSILTDSSKKLVEKALQEAIEFEREVGPDNYNAPPLELEIVKKNMERVWVEVTRKFMRDEGGNPIGIIGIARDISPRKLAEKMYRDEKALVEFYNSLLAHDLGNIHHGIIANLELILELEMPEEVKRLVKGAIALTRRGARLTTDVKKLAKLALGGGLTKTNPQLAIETAIEMVHHSFPDRTVQIEVTGERAANHVYADQFLVDVFFNLLHNAARLDRHEEVKIKLAICEPKNGFVRFDVIDRGPGLSDDEKKMIFAAIGGDENSIRGLGLTLVKQIVDRYNGRIAVEDRVKGNYSEGARFIIWLPSAND